MVRASQSPAQTTASSQFAFPIYSGTQARFASYENVGYGSTDGAFEKDRIVRSANEPNTRDHTYFMLGGARFVYASAVRLAVVKVSYFSTCVWQLR